MIIWNDTKEKTPWPSMQLYTYGWSDTVLIQFLYKDQRCHYFGKYHHDNKRWQILLKGSVFVPPPEGFVVEYWSELNSPNDEIIISISGTSKELPFFGPVA